MLLPEQAQRLFQLALLEFAPDWTITEGCSELQLHHPEHWASGVGTFGFVIRHRLTATPKVLGRRSGGGPDATHHRGVSYRVLEAYADRNTDPIRRYLEEVGALAGSPIGRAPAVARAAGH